MIKRLLLMTLLFAIVLGLSGITLLLCQKPVENKVYAWTGGDYSKPNETPSTHRVLTQKAVEVMKSAYWGADGFYNSDKNNSVVNKLFSDISIYSDWPDTTKEKYSLPQDVHFYHYPTKKGLSGSTVHNAKQYFINYYNNAKDNYISGNKAIAKQELGKAIHYLADLATPVHTGYTGALTGFFNLNQHTGFESKAKTMQGSVVATTDVDFTYDNMQLLNIDDFAEQVAQFSYSHYSTVSMYSDIKDAADKIWYYQGVMIDISIYEDLFNNMIKMCLTRSIDFMATLFFKFSREVVSPIIHPNRIYHIRNVGSGKYLDAQGNLTANGTNVIQYTKKTNENQKWQAIQNSDGTYSLRSVSAPTSYVENYSPDMKLNSGTITDAKKFDVTTSNGKTRISPKSTSNALSVANSDNSTHVQSVAYNANSDYCHWILEETVQGPQPTNNTIYRIRNLDTNMYLDVQGGNTSNGAKVIQYGLRLPNLNQQWKATANSDGTYSFSPQHAPTVYLKYSNGNMTIENGSITDDKKFYISKYNDGMKVMPKTTITAGNTMLVTSNAQSLQVTESLYTYSNLMSYWGLTVA
ncbi:MAG: RICIN domain-containing protein [Christensenellaceae bacterium]|jgi:hypothetical protein|nr:RICIN domain-containing protein [Christensenellaceae bacterium]